MSVVERAISSASANVIFSFLVSLVFQWCSLGSLSSKGLQIIEQELFLPQKYDQLSVGVSGGVCTSGVSAPSSIDDIFGHNSGCVIWSTEAIFEKTIYNFHVSTTIYIKLFTNQLHNTSKLRDRKMQIVLREVKFKRSQS